MSVVRRTAAVAVASGFTALAGLVPALPAMAHGATTQPISRTAACATGGKDVDSAACRAARAANGGPFGNFDNLRVPGVNGKDKQLSPRATCAVATCPTSRASTWPVTTGPPPS